MVKKIYRKKRYITKRKTLKKSNIFGNKSAKSQAKQIYALNRKVNYIQKQNAPEIIKKSFNIVSFASHQPSSIHRINLYKDKLFDVSSVGYEMASDVIRPHGISFSGVVGLCAQSLKFKSEDTTSMSSDYTYLAERPTTVYYRILIAYVKSGGQPVGNPIINLGDPEGVIGFQNMSVINGPLVEHFNQNCWLVKQKIIKVDTYHPSKSFVIKLKGKKLMNYQRSVNNLGSQYNLGKGELVMWIQTLSPVWNSSYTTSSDEHMPQYYCHIDSTMYFVDNI